MKLAWLTTCIYVHVHGGRGEVETTAKMVGLYWVHMSSEASTLRSEDWPYSQLSPVPIPGTTPTLTITHTKLL